MQDPKHQGGQCRTCNAAPGLPCLTEAGDVAERVHWGRPESVGSWVSRGSGKPPHLTPARVWTDEQWAAEHAGTCGAGHTPCGRSARLYPCGWRCTDHQPHAEHPLPHPTHAR